MTVNCKVIFGNWVKTCLQMRSDHIWDSTKLFRLQYIDYIEDYWRLSETVDNSVHISLVLSCLVGGVNRVVDSLWQSSVLSCCEVDIRLHLLSSCCFNKAAEGCQRRHFAGQTQSSNQQCCSTDNVTKCYTFPRIIAEICLCYMLQNNSLINEQTYLITLQSS